MAERNESAEAVIHVVGYIMLLFLFATLFPSVLLITVWFVIMIA